jgi:hypothetical protein
MPDVVDIVRSDRLREEPPQGWLRRVAQARQESAAPTGWRRQGVTCARVAATRRILERIEERFGGRLPSPAAVLGTDPARFRDVGLSWRKISTLRELAERLSDGRLDPNALATLADDELIAVLTEIPGIGAGLRPPLA